MKYVLLITFGLTLFLQGCTQRSIYNAQSPYARDSSFYIEQAAETIVIDAGHGGKDEGATSNSPHVEEKELSLNTAKLVQSHLRKFGYKVVLTRSRDVFVPLDDRASIANNINSTAFVSIHYNAAKSKKAKGIEVYYCDEVADERALESKILAEHVLSKTIAFTEATSRGVKTANYRVIRTTKMPAILVECGFLTNAEERARCNDPIYQEALAWGIARGIDDYMKSIKKVNNCPRRELNARPVA